MNRDSRLRRRRLALPGWYALTERGLVFGWPVPTLQEAMATREVYREIEDQPERREAIAVLVKERCLIA